MDTERKVIIPGVIKEYFSDKRGYFYDMDDSYLERSSPVAHTELVLAMSGLEQPIAGLSQSSCGGRTNVFILGPGKYRREVIQPFYAARSERYFGLHNPGGRQVNLTGFDRAEIDQDTATRFADLIMQHPETQITHIVSDVTNIPALEPLRLYLKGDLPYNKSIIKSRKLNETTPLAVEPYLISCQGMLDYLQPPDAAALITYILRVVDPQVVVFRFVEGALAHKYMKPEDKQVYEESLNNAKMMLEDAGKNRPFRSVLEQVLPKDFFESLLTLDMTDDQKRAENLMPSYPGTHVLMDKLLNLIACTSGYPLKDAVIEEWWLPNEKGENERVSVLLTLRKNL